MKRTNQDLIKENAVLDAKVKWWEEADAKRRMTLSELLDSYEYVQGSYGSGNTRKVLVRDWMGISFLIGELKADADYSCAIEAREELKRHVESLQREIYELKNPKQNEK